MLPDFCLRLATGLTVCLLLLAPGAACSARPFVDARFFRIQFLIVLGLACLAVLFLRSTGSPAVLTAASAGMVLAFLGSLVWALERAPGGQGLIVLTAASLGLSLGLLEFQGPDGGFGALFGGLTSAVLLGVALSAMLLGHSYLTAPSMTIAPLFRLLAALLIALVLRMLVEGYALGRWTGGPLSDKMNGDALLWLPVRWGVGFIAPAILCGMAWQTARIRSTQSATGILYVVVIFCFLGELTGQLLRETGTTL